MEGCLVVPDGRRRWRCDVFFPPYACSISWCVRCSLDSCVLLPNSSRQKRLSLSSRTAQPPVMSTTFDGFRFQEKHFRRRRERERAFLFFCFFFAPAGVTGVTWIWTKQILYSNFTAPPIFVELYGVSVSSSFESKPAVLGPPSITSL